MLQFHFTHTNANTHFIQNNVAKFKFNNVYLTKLILNTEIRVVKLKADIYSNKHDKITFFLKLGFQRVSNSFTAFSGSRREVVCRRRHPGNVTHGSLSLAVFVTSENSR